MNRARAKELLPIIQAYAEGRAIQFALEGHMWTDVNEETAFTFPAEDYSYRIKPEPRECWVNIYNETIMSTVRQTKEGGLNSRCGDEGWETVKFREVIE